MKFVKESIDILSLYTESNFAEWNRFLWECLKRHDVAKLVHTSTRLQVGMDKLVKEKLNTEKVAIFFIRLQRSIENTLKEIYREKYPNPLYDPHNKSMYDDLIGDKRQKDHELELFIKKSRY